MSGRKRRTGFMTISMNPVGIAVERYIPPIYTDTSCHKSQQKHRAHLEYPTLHSIPPFNNSPSLAFFPPRQPTPAWEKFSHAQCGRHTRNFIFVIINYPPEFLNPLPSPQLFYFFMLSRDLFIWQSWLARPWSV